MQKRSLLIILFIVSISTMVTSTAMAYPCYCGGEQDPALAAQCGSDYEDNKDMFSAPYQQCQFDAADGYAGCTPYGSDFCLQQYGAHMEMCIADYNTCIMDAGSTLTECYRDSCF
jgi:hypothetical protein